MKNKTTMEVPIPPYPGNYVLICEDGHVKWVSYDTATLAKTDMSEFPDLPEGTKWQVVFVPVSY